MKSLKRVKRVWTKFLVGLFVIAFSIPAYAGIPKINRDEIIDYAKTAVGSWYVWGGDKWDPNNRSWAGADCSGLVIKAWQIPKKVGYKTSVGHPWSTWHFYNQSTHWFRINKSNIKTGDVYVRRSSSGGHCFIFHKNNSWGKPLFYEAWKRGTRIRYGTRSVTSNYVAIRRKSLVANNNTPAPTPAPTPSTSGKVQEVTASVLNVRSGPSTGYRVLGQVRRGQKYVVVSQSNGWFKIYFDGQTGWTSGKYMKGVSGSVKTVRINISALNVRRGPSTGYGRVGTTHKPEQYVVISSSGKWRKVYFDGYSRWLYAGNNYATEQNLNSSNTSQPTPQPTQPTPQPTQPTSTPANVVNPNTMTKVFAVDVSHWSGNLSDSSARGWKQRGVKLVICGTQRRAITRQQLQMATKHGLAVDAYVYIYFNGNVTAKIKEALSICQGYPVGRLWIDIEDKPNGRSPAQLKAKINEAIRAAGNFPVGIYTAAWWWKPHMKNSSDFAHLPLWYARYDKNSDMSTWSFQKFGGWKTPMGKQYQGTTKLSGINVDLNTFWLDKKRLSNP